MDDPQPSPKAKYTMVLLFAMDAVQRLDVGGDINIHIG